ADDLFRGAETVNGRGIDQSDPAIDCGMDRADRFSFVGAAPHPSTHRPRAQTYPRKLKTRTSDACGFHIAAPFTICLDYSRPVEPVHRRARLLRRSPRSARLREGRR